MREGCRRARRVPLACCIFMKFTNLRWPVLPDTLSTPLLAHTSARTFSATFIFFSADRVFLNCALASSLNVAATWPHALQYLSGV